MTVLNYEIKTNLIDHHDFLAKLKDFCFAQGWTIDDFRQNILWANTAPQYYDWVIGDESFLEITSSGYGAQTLNFRFRTESAKTDPQHEWLHLGAQNGIPIDHSSYLHPVDQGSWNISKLLSLPPSAISQVWFFGNSKFILCAIKLADDYVTFLTFGSIELFDIADDEGNFAGYTFSAGDGKWYNKNDQIPFDFDGSNIYYDGGLVGYSRYACDLMLNTGNSFAGEFARGYGRTIVKNSYSEVRPAAKPNIFIKHISDDLWRPMGTYPIFRINTYDLKIGEKIKYGTEEYITFPDCRGNNERYMGLAVRIL